MKKNPIEMAQHLSEGMVKLTKANKESMEALGGFIQCAFKDGAIDAKTKELIAVSISAYSRCEYCIVAHVKSALEAGCKREEIIEAATVAMGFGGGPSMAYTSTLLMDALDAFDK